MRDFLFPARTHASSLFTCANTSLTAAATNNEEEGEEEKNKGGTKAKAHSTAKGPSSHPSAQPSRHTRATEASKTSSSSTSAAAAAAAAAKKGGSGDDSNGWGRPVDALLQFFPRRCTRKAFLDAAKLVITEEHFLQPGEFWDAFASAEYVGEGSFGLVWRCRTVDGDLVAVKSCPISLASRPAIEDAFSTVREVATMRFLNEMQVPYVLPLHSAFCVSAREALPPDVAAALDWQRECRQRAEATVVEREVKMLSTGTRRGGENGKKGGKGCAASSSSSSSGAAGGGVAAHGRPRTFEEEVQYELARMEAAEGEADKARRAAFSSVTLPRFLSISAEDVLQCDATVFLVLELCDGDVEGIDRTDGIAKGVAYCVSSALSAMHELGLLHLDLKPSNILYAYEHGPSQQPPPPQQQPQPVLDFPSYPPPSLNSATTTTAVTTTSHVTSVTNAWPAPPTTVIDFTTLRSSTPPTETPTSTPATLLTPFDAIPTTAVHTASAAAGQEAEEEGSSPAPSHVSAAVTAPVLTSTAGRAVKFYLSDFGNCRVVGPAKEASVADAFGTFEYMDLRALKDAVCGRPTDAFSLGSTLYEILFGKRVYPRCANPKCTSDADHTRFCFVEAAKRPIVLPVGAAATAEMTTTTTTAVEGGGRECGRGGPGRGRGRGGKGALAHKTHPPAPTEIASSGTGKKIALTTLQKLTAALLRPKWSERMTAAQCHAHLLKAYHITQADVTEADDSCGGGGGVGELEEG